MLIYILFPALTLGAEIPTIEIKGSNENTQFYHHLDGDWIFFPEKLLSPQEIRDALQEDSGEIVTLPSSFEEQSGKINTFGTYVTTVTIPEEYIGETIAIHIPFQYSAYTLYVNDLQIAKNGTVGTSASSHQAEMAPKSGYFIATDDDMILTMQVSSFSHIRGGFENSIFIGDASIVTQKSNTNMIITLFINGCIFIIGLFMVLFSLYRKRELLFLVFGLFAMSISARALFSVPFYYTMIFPEITWLWGTRFEYLLTTSCSMLFVILLWIWHKKEFSKKVMQFLVAVHITTMFVIMVTQPVFFQAFFFKVFLLAIPTFFYTVYVITKSIRNKNRIAKINLTGMLLIFLAFFNDFAMGNSWYQFINLMLPAVGIYVIIHVIVMSKDFAKRANQIEAQYEELVVLNESNIELTNKLQEEIKQKDNFLSNTSHELRNPLHGIINISQALLLHHQESLDKQVQEKLQLQITIGTHMRQTLNDLLDVTRLKEQRIQLQQEPIYLQGVVNGVVDMLKVLTDNKNIQIENKITEDFPAVYADDNRLIQIFFNLIHNAIKYTPDGKITILAKQKQDFAEIHVTDTGIGMDESMLQTIFNPYTQADPSITTIGSGIGLGLSIVHELVELHGGSIHVTSKVGEGSTFSFTLALADEQVALRSTTKENQTMMIESLKTNHLPQEILNNPSTARNKIQILAVDDDAVNLKILKNVLSAETYEITVVTSGELALKKLPTKNWDLIITDVMMPNMSGYELTKRIRDIYSVSQLPILLLTARGNAEDISSGFLAGANDYVTKPVDATELNARVHALTHLQQSIKQRLNMEAAWLQAQIKPHFILNTLNAIASLSEIDLNRMTALIERFADYLERSFHFKNIDTFVPLADELELLQSYLYIEKIRFGHRLNIEWKIDVLDKEKDILIPPLALQTLVENAANHGVLQKAAGGTITIQIISDKEKTSFLIHDDGVGMDEETLNHLLNPAHRDRHGIGIVNTDQRLKQLFGTGLTIISEKGSGTSVTFDIPHE